MCTPPRTVHPVSKMLLVSKEKLSKAIRERLVGSWCKERKVGSRLSSPPSASLLPSFFSSFLPSSLTSFLFWRDWNYRFPLLVRESCDSHRLLLCSGKADSPLAARARPRPRCPPLPLRRHPAPPAIRMAVEEVVGRKGGGEGGREKGRRRAKAGWKIARARRATRGGSRCKAV